MGVRGSGLSPKDAHVAEHKLDKKHNITHPWKNDMVGKDWCLAFTRRKNLSLRKSEELSRARAAVIIKEIKQCFDIWERY